MTFSDLMLSRMMIDSTTGDGLRESRYFVGRIGGPVTGRDKSYAQGQAWMGWVLNVAMPCTSRRQS